MAEQKKAKRNANIELLRIISMIMIIFLHALGKGKLLVNLTESPSVNGVIAWILESLSISAVNTFVLISGFFLIDGTFKLRRMVSLICEAVFYGVFSFLMCMAFRVDFAINADTYFYLQTIFPVHMEVFWFITSYLVIYMLQPLISAGVKNMSQKQFGTMLIVLIVYECIFKTMLPVKLAEDEQGYNVLWFLIVFLLGAYFKLYGFRYIRTVKSGFMVYLVAVLLIFMENTAIDFVIAKLGHLKEISGISLTYNHLFVLVASIGIFAAFINMREMKDSIGHIVCAISPMSLGVYLLHESLPFRYNWQRWLGIYDSLEMNTLLFICRLITAVIVVFILGITVDYFRIKLFGIVERMLARGKD